jgi:hypothetical protein
MNNGEINLNLLEKIENEFLDYIKKTGREPKCFLVNDGTFGKLLMEVKKKSPWIVKNIGQLKEEGFQYRGLFVNVENRLSDSEIIAT